MMPRVRPGPWATATAISQQDWREGRPFVRDLESGRDLELALACTAHELRGPLVSAKAAIEVAAHVGYTQEACALLEECGTELERASELIDGLIRWAAGPTILQRGVNDLVSIARSAIRTCTLQEPTDRIHIIAPDSLPAMVDGEHLHTALTNLIRNALEYSPVDSPVTVLIQTSDGVARIQVSDHGMGIPPEYHRTILEPFDRGPMNARDRRAKGLGLYIAHRIVEAHGGWLWVESSEEGSTFCMAVPEGQASEAGADLALLHPLTAVDAL